MMTQYEIVRLAKSMQLQIWSREVEYADSLPGNEFARAREQRAWAKVNELDRMLEKLEKDNANR